MKQPSMYSDSKLRATRDYSLFVDSVDNRIVDLAKRKKLRQSMAEHGFLPAYPLHVIRLPSGKLRIRDGQHRFAVAQELGLPVYYVACEADVSIPDINNTQRPWNLHDYAGSFANQNKRDYVTLAEFSRQHNLSLSMSVYLLGDILASAQSCLLQRFRSGRFVVKDRARADRVANLYNQIGALCPAVKTRFLLSALTAVCAIPQLDDERLLTCARRCPEQLMKYGSRDGYLAMLETIYNYGRHAKLPLKFLAENIIRERNPATRNKPEPIEQGEKG